MILKLKEQQMEYLTPEQEFAKKSEALTQLERMDRKGITGNKMTMANPPKIKSRPRFI